MKSNHCTSRLYRSIAVWAGALVFLVPTLCARDKTDVIILKNGDRITGEIQGLEHGQLRINPHYTKGPIVVDWEEVDRLESVQRFQIEVVGGGRRVGTLNKKQAGVDESSPRLEIADEMTSVNVYKPAVVNIRQMGRSFISKLDGSIDYGFDFTKANDHITSSLNSAIEYDAERDIVRGTVSSQFNGQKDGTNTNRLNTTIVYQRFLRRKKVFAGVLADFLTSDQQQLDLRTTVGGGLGRVWMQTNKTKLSSLGGLVLNTERFSTESGPEPRQNNVEALATLEFLMHRFDSTEITTRLSVFPSLTGGRVRMNLDTSLKLDLVRDLYWNFSFFENCPASAGNGEQRSAVKLTEGTHEKNTKALHSPREGRHFETASGGQGAGLEALRRTGAAADGVLPLAEGVL